MRRIVICLIRKTSVFITATGLVAIGACAFSSDRPTPAVASLRKPPPAASPWPDKVRAAVRASDPQLFTAPADEGNTLIVIALNGDGTTYKMKKRALGVETVATGQTTYDEVGVNIEDFQVIGTTGAVANAAIVLGSPDVEPSQGMTQRGSTTESLIIFYGVLCSTLDPTQPTSLVRTAVQKRFEHLVRRPKSTVFNRVTVYMNNSGRIDRARSDTVDFAERQPAFLIAADFFSLGLTAEQVGQIGQAVISEDQDPDGTNKVLLVNFAWPRKDTDGPVQPVINRFAAAANDGGVSLAIVSHYIPDAFDTPKLTPGPWVLLDHEGRVLQTGHFPTTDWGQMTQTFSALTPGIRLQAMSLDAITNRAGKSVMVAYAWLTPDSPVPKSDVVR
jgi:hypothetical protein